MKKVFRVIRWFFTSLLLLVVVLWVLLQLPPVQTWITQYIAGVVEDETGYRLEVGSVDLRFPVELLLDEVVCFDLRGDTLLATDRLAIGALGDQITQGKIEARNVVLEAPHFHLIIAENDSLTNLDPLLNYFGTSDTTSGASTRIDVDRVQVTRGHFTYHDYNTQVIDSIVDFNHLDINELNIDVSSFHLQGDSIDARLNKIALRDVSGFELKHLGGKFTMRPDTMMLERMSLITPRSEIKGMVRFVADEWSDYNNFTSKVKMHGEFDSSTVYFGDIAYFAPDLIGLDRAVVLDGTVRGRVNNLKGRDLFIGIDQNTWFRGDIDMQGLPDIDQTFIDLTIDELHSRKAELDRLPLPPFGEQKTLKTPANISTLGDIEFHGKFTGFFTDFVAFGTLDTKIGKVRSDLKFKEEDDDFAYSGKLETIDFNLGQFYSTIELGGITSSFTLEGRGLTRSQIDATIDGRIDEFKAHGYLYQDIIASGTFREDFFNGQLSVRDDNAQLEFDGLIDFSGKLPRMDFITKITHLNLVELKLLKDYEYTSISGDFRINGTGSNLNNINGELIGDDILFCTARNEYPIEDFDLYMVQREDGKSFRLESDVASGQLDGKFDFTGLESGIKQIIADVIPHVTFETEGKRGREDFRLDLQVHNFELVSDVFIPELELADGSRFSLLMNDKTEDFESIFTTDRISWNDYHADTLTIDISHPDDALYVTVLSDQFTIDNGLTLKEISIDLRNDADTIYSNLVWGGTDELIRGDITSISVINDNNDVANRIDLATLWFDNKAWVLQDTTRVDVVGERIDIDRFHLANESSFIKINGVVDRDPSKTLDLNMQGIDLALFNVLTGPQGIMQTGTINGSLSLRDLYDRTYVSSDLDIVQYYINDILIGNISTESSWQPQEKRLLLEGEIERKDLKTLSFDGYYYPDDKDSPLDLVCSLDDQPLSFLNAFLTEGVSDFKGKISGEVTVTGQVSAPELEGVVTFNNASLFVDYLNTRYTFNESASIFPDQFWLDFPVKDEDGNEAFMAGTISHENFAKWNFDIFLDMYEPFLCLNTTVKENSLYYGRALATGFASVFGTDEKLEIDVNVRSSKGTSLALPLGGSEDVTFEDFITFVDRSAPEEKETPLDLSGITMNFELDITPDAEFRIIFDELVGDEISGRGQGHINMVINNLSDFNMYGDISVTQGRYLFTLKNLINKEFEVEPGGQISWYGDPLAADINLKALYKLHTSLYDLVPDETDTYKQRVPVNLVMNLNGKLMSPGIDFDIVLPSSDELTRARVESAINNEQEMNRQAFALLVLRRFISPPDIAKTNTSLGLAENSTELLTSQLSNWLSQISDDFDIGVNYSPGDEISNEELAVALSTQLFNDRLLVSGNFGVASAQNPAAGENPNSLIGDIRIEYKIDENGKIRLIVYNESNQFDIANTQQSNYTQGMGIVYQEEFDSLYELFKLR